MIEVYAKRTVRQDETGKLEEVEAKIARLIQHRCPSFLVLSLSATITDQGPVWRAKFIDEADVDRFDEIIREVEG